MFTSVDTIKLSLEVSCLIKPFQFEVDYNRKRRHSKLGYVSPEAVEAKISLSLSIREIRARSNQTCHNLLRDIRIGINSLYIVQIFKTVYQTHHFVGIIGIKFSHGCGL